MIVADANVIAYLLIEGEHTAQAQAVLRRDPVWVAPPLWQSEFRNVLTLYLRRGVLTLPDALALYRDAETLMRTMPVDAEDILRLVVASTRSAYDCEYVALAEALGVRLVTNDGGVLRDFPQIAVSMEKFTSA